MDSANELDAALRYIDAVLWIAEEDHYRDHSHDWDRDIHGRVYALADLRTLLSRELADVASPTREQIISVLDSQLTPLEQEFARRPDAAHLDLGGRVFALREVRAAIIAGEHLKGNSTAAGAD